MRIWRLVGTAMAAIALGAGASACGGGDDEEQAAAPPPPPAANTEASTEAAPPPPETTEATTSSAVEGDITPPGTVLALGETAHVTIKPLTAEATSTKTYPVDATVLKIEKGSIDDFANIQLDEAQKAATPYYVTVRISNPGPEAVPVKDSDPDVRFDGVDDRGQEQGTVIFLGTFDRCDNTEAPDPFTSGKSYDSCHVFLVPGGGSITEAHWSGSDDYILEPVVWK
jgi:hypothetical protein